VRDETEAIIEETVARGTRNQRVVELATAHCLNFEWRSFGGVGMVEQATGLPVGMRLPHCVYAKTPGGMAGADLERVALGFHATNCIGCPHRSPTGRVPNLTTLAKERRAAQDRADHEHQARLEIDRADWRQRRDHRAAIVACATDAVTGPVLADVGLLDAEPDARDEADARAAIGRLRAVAERAPEQLTDVVATHLLQLVEQEQEFGLLAVLRPVAASRPHCARPVLEAALAILGRFGHLEAGRCVVDLSGAVAPTDISADVVTSLARLAVPPDDDGAMAGIAGLAGASGDPTPLRAAANLAPESVRTALEGLLRVPAMPSPLVLPAGARPAAPAAAGDVDRAAAAAAVAALSASHAELAAGLADPLLSNLAVPDEDHYGLHARSRVARAAACLLLRDLGDIPRRLLAVGEHAGEGHRAALVDVVQHAAWLLDPEPSWPQRDDPTPTAEERGSLVQMLAGLCLRLTGGCWGDDVTFTSAKLLEDLAKDHPDLLLAQLPALLGAALDIDYRSEQPVRPSPLLVGRPPEPMLAGLEQFSRTSALGGAAQRLLDAVGHLAQRDVKGVLAAVRELLADQRDREATSPAAWRLLHLIGALGTRHGADPAVLNAVLPVLHTCLVSTDAALRTAAIDAWTDIAARHPDVPHSLSDLLPALVSDPSVGVVQAVLRAARRLRWDALDRARLVLHAATVAQEAVASAHPEAFKDGLLTLRALVRDDAEEVRTGVERRVLKLAAHLDRYALQDLLRGSWGPSVATSPEMARLWLRQARDPIINDRLNAGDDDELVALLGCGSGVAGIAVEELTAAAGELGPDHPVAAAEFAEVAWRAGRPADAEAVLRAVLAATPEQPVYRRTRALLELWALAAAADAAAGGGHGVHLSAVRAAAQVVADAASDDADQDGPRGAGARQVAARAVVRGVLHGMPADAELLALTGLPPDLAPVAGADPAAVRRRLGEQLAAAAEVVASAAQARTPTGAAVRAATTVCDVASRLLRLQAATLDADLAEAAAQLAAARGRAAVHLQAARESLTDDDPVGGPLVALLGRAAALGDSAGDVATWLVDAARLPLPLLWVRGPRRWTAGARAGAGRALPVKDAPPVVVALASLDGRLVTDTQVMTPHRVHTLELEVRLDDWPDWAERLEATFVSALRTPDEAEIPDFRWTRPADPAVSLTGDGTLIIRFTIPAGGRAQELVLNMRFLGTVDGEPFAKRCEVAGHPRLRVRPFDASVDVTTGWSSVDERLVARYERLHSAAYGEEEIQAYCRLLTAICRAALRMSYEAQYRAGTKVTERLFHDDLEARLRADPELGGRVERGTRAALGFLDLRHDGVTAELKVEPRTEVTQERAPKYLGQPTQYAASDGVRLSIVVVLDMSPKRTSPVGTPENYLWDLQPRLHGLTNSEAPSLTTVVVVNGALPPPSRWSRRKVLVVPGGPDDDRAG